jgi:omega-amidase
MEELRISMIQTELVWEECNANLEALARMIRPLAQQTDLIILPEMFTTGFTMAAARLAEPTPGPTLEWMQEQAALTGAAITGSYIAGDEKGHYNRLVWMHPDGRYDHYDKRHLFTLAGEQNHYLPGRRHLIVEYRGWRILPLVCYDLRFPVWSRNTQSYDLLIYVANWPERRAYAWRQLLIARAIENQAYTIGVNRIGRDGNEVYYSGDSMLLDYAGQVRYRAAHTTDTFTTTISRQEQDAFRQKFRFLADRDRFHIDD